MSNNDLPNDGTVDESLSFFEGVEALEDVLGSPEEDPEKSKVQNTAEDEGEAEAELDDDAELSDDLEDDEGSDADDEDDSEEDNEAESLELSDELEIDLGDGRKATLADLKGHYGQVQKRVADFQRDYSQKTDALAQDRKEIETQSQRLMEWAEQIKQQRDFVMSYQQQFMPKPPSPDEMDDDPIGYMRRKAEYDQAVVAMQQLQSQTAQERQRQQSEEQEKEQKFLKKEKEKMLERIPEFSNPEKFEAFRRDLVEVFAPAYEFTPEEISTVRDSRFAKVMRDAMAYQKLKAEQPKAKAKIVGKPPVITSGKSLSKQGKAAKDKAARQDALRKTGSLEAGISALMDLDL